MSGEKKETVDEIGGKTITLAPARMTSSHKQLPRRHRLVFIALIKRLGTVVVVIVYVLSSLDMIVSALLLLLLQNKQLPADDLHTINVQAGFIKASAENDAASLSILCCL